MLRKVIVVTGLSVDDIRALFPTVCQALAKPVMPSRLLAVVNVKAFGWRLPFHVFPSQLLWLLGVALAAAFCALMVAFRNHPKSWATRCGHRIMQFFALARR